MLTLIVDDHPLFSDGLRLLLLAALPSAEVDCCKDGEEALRLAAQSQFELVLLDWNLGSGIAGVELVGELKAALPHARIVIISGDSSPEVIRTAVESGAVGYVPKESPPALLIDALTITAHGGIYLPSSVLAGTARRPGPETTLDPPIRGELQGIRDAFPQLTPRHLDVLERVARGMSNKHVARELNISEGTVKQHLNAIYRELRVENRTEAVYLLATSGVRFT